MRLSAPVKVSLFASADAVADAGTDPQLATQTKKLKLKPGKSKTLKFKFTYPGTLPDGAYSLLAVADPDTVKLYQSTQGRRGSMAETLFRITLRDPYIRVKLGLPPDDAAE